MKYYGKAEETANAILKAFQNPSGLPAKLAPMFIKSNSDIPCRSWSWGNQLLVALNGHHDARGFRQWTEAGRHVKKGERAFQILIPLIRKMEKDGDEKSICYGFKSCPVFGVEQTEGDPVSTGDPETDAWLESLPLREVADSWGLSVTHYNGGKGALGYYKQRKAIALGVKNLSTWAHELTHAADDRCVGGLKGGRRLDQETVAEFGGAIILSILGEEMEADLGGCWDYVRNYAEAEGKEPIGVCMKFLKRTCDAVALILDTAEKLRTPEAIAA